jgi:Na+-driven multidrug efflux pump
MLLIILETCIISLLFIILRNQIVLIYIDSDQIYELANYGVIIMQVSFIFDCIQIGLNGIVKGRGL